MAALVALIGLFDMNGAAAIGLYLTFFGGVASVTPTEIVGTGAVRVTG